MITPPQAIVERLKSDAAVTAGVPGDIWIDVAPQGAATPLLLVIPVAMPVRTPCAGTTRIEVSAGLVVWAFGTDEQVSSLDAVLEAVKDRLHKKKWSAAPDWAVTASTLREMYETVRSDGTDARWHAIGHRYEVVLQEV